MNTFVTIALSMLAGAYITFRLIPYFVSNLAPSFDALRRLYAWQQAEDLEKATHKHIFQEMSGRLRFEIVMYNYTSQGVPLAQELWRMFRDILKAEEQGYENCPKERVRAAYKFLEEAEKAWDSYFSKKPPSEDWSEEAKRTLRALFEMISLHLGGPS